MTFLKKIRLGTRPSPQSQVEHGSIEGLRVRGSSQHDVAKLRQNPPITGKAQHLTQGKLSSSLGVRPDEQPRDRFLRKLFPKTPGIYG